MNISIYSASKTKSDFFISAEAEYLKRLKPYAKLSIEELNLKISNKLSADEVIKLEASELTKKIKTTQNIIALEPTGKQFQSEEFASYLERHFTNISDKISFVIGGAHGLSAEISRSSILKLSLSKLTFNHQLARLILVEQIYRAISIIKGDPYHK